MKFGEWLKLNEMPITGMNFVPPQNWPELSGGKKRPGYGYNKKDLGILTSEPGRAKIINKWSNTKQNFVFYFVRSPQAKEYQEVGERSADWVKDRLGVDIQPGPEDITVLFTQNIGAEKIPMTAWMLAHRLGHAIKRTRGWSEFSGQLQEQLAGIMQDVYNTKIRRTQVPSWDSSEPTRHLINDPDSHRSMKHLANNIGTMASARNQKLFNYYEFEYELFAQYLLTGKVTFNSLKETLVKGAFGRPGIYSGLSQQDLADHSENLNGIATGCEYYLDWALNELEGKIFVM
jgi:hypothetical protein